MMWILTFIVLYSGSLNTFSMQLDSKHECESWGRAWYAQAQQNQIANPSAQYKWTCKQEPQQ